jgi:hypothetical protein
MRRSILTGLAASVLLVASCGDAQHISITPSASRQLRVVVAQVRAAASSGDAPTAAARLKEIRSRVIELRRQGELSENAATRIVLAADAVEADLRLAPTTTTTPTPTTTTTPEPKPGEKHHHRGHDGGD